MTRLPQPEDAARLTAVLQAPAVVRILGQALPRLARLGRRPDSDFYVESRDVDQVISYVMAHS